MKCEPRHENKCSVHAKEGNTKSISGYVPSERDWTEDFEHENGKYFCTCGQCKNIFMGHKRHVRCKLCGYGSNPETAFKPDFDKLAEGQYPVDVNSYKRGCSEIWDAYVVPLLKENERLKDDVCGLEDKLFSQENEDSEELEYYKELSDKADKVIEASENLMTKGILDEIANVYHSRSLKEYQELKQRQP